jgi:hypothetical protein
MKKTEEFTVQALELVLLRRELNELVVLPHFVSMTLSETRLADVKLAKVAAGESMMTTAETAQFSVCSRLSL